MGTLSILVSTYLLVLSSMLGLMMNWFIGLTYFSLLHLGDPSRANKISKFTIPFLPLKPSDAETSKLVDVPYSCNHCNNFLISG